MVENKPGAIHVFALYIMALGFGAMARALAFEVGSVPKIVPAGLSVICVLTAAYFLTKIEGVEKFLKFQGGIIAAAVIAYNTAYVLGYDLWKATAVVFIIIVVATVIRYLMILRKKSIEQEREDTDKVDVLAPLRDLLKKIKSVDLKKWFQWTKTPSGKIILVAVIIILGLIIAYQWGWIGSKQEKPVPLQNLTVPNNETREPAATPIPPVESKEKQPTTPSFEYNLAGNGSVSAVGPDNRTLFTVNAGNAGEAKLYAEGAIKDSGKVTGTFIMYGCTGKCNYSEFADEKTKEFLRGLLNK